MLVVREKHQGEWQYTKGVFLVGCRGVRDNTVVVVLHSVI